MIDLSTKAGVLRFCELRRAEMAGLFRVQGHFDSNGHSFMAYAFMTHAITGLDTSVPAKPRFITGPKLPSIEAWPCRLPEKVTVPWTSQTSFFGQTVADFARAGKATGVLSCGEAFMVIRDPADTSQRQSGPYGWVEEQPDRVEILWMQLEHQTFGLKLWRAHITRDEQERPTLHPWSEAPPEATTGKGRLTDLIDWRS